jgi:hypothetical protein
MGRQLPLPHGLEARSPSESKASRRLEPWPVPHRETEASWILATSLRDTCPMLAAPSSTRHPLQSGRVPPDLTTPGTRPAALAGWVARLSWRMRRRTSCAAVSSRSRAWRWTNSWSSAEIRTCNCLRGMCTVDLERCRLSMAARHLPVTRSPPQQPLHREFQPRCWCAEPGPCGHSNCKDGAPSCVRIEYRLAAVHRDGRAGAMTSAGPDPFAFTRPGTSRISCPDRT